MRTLFVFLMLVIAVNCFGCGNCFGYELGDAELDSESYGQLEEVVELYERATGVDLYGSAKSEVREPVPAEYEEIIKHGRIDDKKREGCKEWKVFYDEFGRLDAVCK